MSDTDFQDVVDALECNCIEGGTSEPDHCSYCRCVATVKRLISTTGDFGAVPDPVPSVPSGDSVTLIETIRSVLQEAVDREFTDEDHSPLFALPALEALRVLELRESDRQSSESKGLEATSAAVAGAEDLLRRLSEWDMLWVGNPDTGQPPATSDGPYWQHEIAKVRQLLASTTAAQPPPESGSSGLGSASALEVEASVWIAYYLNYEQSDVIAVAVSEASAIQAVKEMFGHHYVVEWRVERRTYNKGDDEAVTLIGEFEQVASYSTKHTATYSIYRMPLASATKPEASPSLLHVPVSASSVEARQGQELGDGHSPSSVEVSEL